MLVVETVVRIRREHASGKAIKAIARDLRLGDDINATRSRTAARSNGCEWQPAGEACLFKIRPRKHHGGELAHFLSDAGCFNASLSCGAIHARHDFAEKFGCIAIQGSSYSRELDDIDPPLASLNVADVGLAIATR